MRKKHCIKNGYLMYQNRTVLFRLYFLAIEKQAFRFWHVVA